MDSTSESLLRRLRQPDQEAAWQRFVRLYAPLIFHWGMNHGLSSDDAADLVQEVMALLVEKLPKFEYDPTKRFRGWLRTVTLNKANDLHRRNAARPATALVDASPQISVADAVDLFAEAEYRHFLVRRALELMQSEFDERSWRACWQHVVEGRTASDVALDLGVTVNMVYLAKSRILARLRQELADLID